MNLKGPFPLPIIGNLIPLLRSLRNDRLNAMQKLFETYGSTVCLLPPGQPAHYTTISPDNVKYITSAEENFSNYCRDPEIRSREMYALRLLFGDGIFHADGDIWKTQRQQSQPLFAKASLDSMHSVFVEKAKILCSILDESARGKSTVDLQSLFLKYTLDAFGCIGFGTEIGSLTSDSMVFPKHFDAAQRLLNKIFFVPFMAYTSAMDEYKEHVKEIDKFLYALIETPANDQKFDLLSKFKQLVDNTKPESKKWLRDIIANFAIAGRDTTATLMTWTVYCLVKNPEVLEKVKKELFDVLGPSDSKIPTVSDLNNMQYLGYVLSETLRLYPPVPFTGRFARKDDVLPDGTHVPANSLVMYSAYFMGRDPESWTDAEKFIPERWQDQRMHPFQYVPFHAGPMQCLGRHMALREAKTLLSLLLRRYSFSLNPGQAVNPDVGILLSVENGLHLTVERLCHA
eukprot:TRINITY_DN6265_c0_g1_i2.p1 TRINITY_DN6265_c0_g1~~TRINITY_DN6265_c0_g1_i2.p1  ORF type:complete len:457 (-),score=79.32 TRINITY_DN6265_c0_g1_i2:146-1516(-)